MAWLVVQRWMAGDQLGCGMSGCRPADMDKVTKPLAFTKLRGGMEEGKVRYQTSGALQGGVISPLLSNIYLTVPDNALTEAGYTFVRYADDVLILCRR